MSISVSSSFRIQHSMLDVQCSMFILPSSSLSSRSYVCFFIFSHSTFDVGRLMFDVHFFQSLLGKNNLVLKGLVATARGQSTGLPPQVLVW